MALIALKVDVDTWRGTAEDVPRLLAALRSRSLAATFYFSVGPDHTGRAIRRVFRRGFVAKVRRTSVLRHYGLRTLLHGLVLPGPRIARRAGDVMRSVQDAGHEVGIHCHDHVLWQDRAAHADRSWTRRQLELACEEFRSVFGVEPRTHAAAGWQVNTQLFELEDELGFEHASDTRGSRPFYPTVGGVRRHCVQLPTTLPTLDELLGVDGATAAVAVDRLVHAARPGGPDHVYTLHAELEGRAYVGDFGRLVDAWRARGHRLVTLRAYAASIDRATTASASVIRGTVPGRSGMLAVQSV